MRRTMLVATILMLCAILTGIAQEATPQPSTAPPPKEETKDQKLNTFRKVDGMENWNYTYDVSDIDRGTYNIIIQGTDKAGNVYYSTPVNILIDPESDLPVVSITNPVPDMRVGGAVLNIVGTCVDDDAVAKVEVKIDNGEFKAAEGKDFWSYKLSTEGMEDGKHTIEVRGVDVNNTVGQSIVRNFHLDTHKPVNLITSHASGVLLSGGKELEGSVQDTNGIASLVFSDDGAKTFKPLNFWYKQEDNKYYFKLFIDTVRMEDGPHVLWLKSTDKMDSVGLSAFLFFVDNKKPTIEILAPLKDEKVNGKFYVVGKVQDEIGIASLSYQHRDKTGDIPLIPGNPYWFIEIDATPFQSSSETVVLTVKDTTGNVVRLEQRIEIDTAADKPVVEISFPAANASTGPNVDVFGFLDDDDEGDSIVWSLDNKEGVTVPAKEGFSFKLEQLEPGKHTLAVYGLDVNKVKGDKKTVEFTVLGNQSTIRLESVVVQNNVTSFYPGAEIGRYDRAVLRGKVSEYERFKKVRYSVGGSEERDLSLRGTADKYLREFDLALTDNIPFGVVEIKITATDSFDRTAEYATFVHVTNYTKIFAKPGIYIADARLESGTITISEEYPFEMFFVGDKVKSVVMDPASSLRITENAGRIRITPSSGSDSASGKITVTTVNNEVFSSDRYSFSASGDYFQDALHKIKPANVTGPGGSNQFYPGIAFANPDGQAKIEGACSSEVAKGEYSFNNKDWRGFDYRRTREQEMSNFTIAVPREISFGYNELYIRLYDEKQRTAGFKTFFFKTDSTGSVARDDEGIYFIDSRIGSNNEVHISKDEPLVGLLNGPAIKSVSLRPATGFLKVSNNGNFIIVEAAGEGKSGAVNIEAVTSNNRTFSSSAYVFATDTTPPVISFTSPQSGDWVNKSITLAGKVTESTGIQALEYSLGSQDNWKKLILTADRGQVPFSQTIDLSSVPDGKTILYVRATDAGGNQALWSISLKKDTQNPEISLITPDKEAKVNGIFSVIGRITDAGRVTKLEFSSDGRTWLPVEGKPVFAYNLDLGAFKVLPEKYYLRATDASGNALVFNPEFPIDFEADKPTVEIQIPAKGETMRNDFVISGMVFDDDGVKSIAWRLDDKEFVKIEGSNSFSIPIQLADIADNEHKIEVVAEDLNGIKGNIASSTFFISKAEPVSALTSPSIDVTARGNVTISGTSTDTNGIKAVYVSFDNGNTYSLATGKDKWSYNFNTNLLADGVHRLLIKAVDNTGTDGLSATLIHVDNTVPTLSLDRPLEGETVTDTLLLDGRAFDNIVLSSLSVNIAPVNQPGADATGTNYSLTTGGVFVKQIDMNRAREGWYNIRIEARDKANNITYITRNVRVEQKKVTNRIEQIFPQDGEELAGNFTLCGRVVSEIPVTKVSFALDDKAGTEIEINESGYFSIDFGPEQVADGEHTVVISAALKDGSTILSEKKRITYTAKGPWVRITSLKTGDFITKRPWMKGDAGYNLPAVPREDKENFPRYEQELRDNRIDKIEISFDNGKSFVQGGGTTEWSFRLQTQDIPDGLVRIIIRATTASGKSAITRAIVNNDDRPPSVRVLMPEEGKRFNDRIIVMGIASDENGLSDVQINLRRGDKTAYSIPEFIQGMYIDFQARTQFTGTFAWGAGFGFTFFDQNVRLQAHVGYEPSERFGGLFLGAKLLANILKIPFESLFGPDWDFFSMSFALGANFSYCTNSGYDIAFSDQGRLLTAAIIQWEFAKFKIQDWSTFNTYSFYAEYQIWFLATDVPGAPTMVMRLMFGARIGLF